ncbi:MAG: hypothetical protein WC492_04315 [Candidatus Micrarchaeia archaeon]
MPSLRENSSQLLEFQNQALVSQTTKNQPSKFQATKNQIPYCDFLIKLSSDASKLSPPRTLSSYSTQNWNFPINNYTINLSKDEYFQLAREMFQIVISGFYSNMNNLSKDMIAQNPKAKKILEDVIERTVQGHVFYIGPYTDFEILKDRIKYGTSFDSDVISGLKPPKEGEKVFFQNKEKEWFYIKKIEDDFLVFRYQVKPLSLNFYDKNQWYTAAYVSSTNSVEIPSFWNDSNITVSTLFSIFLHELYHAFSNYSVPAYRKSSFSGLENPAALFAQSVIGNYTNGIEKVNYCDGYTGFATLFIFNEASGGLAFASDFVDFGVNIKEKITKSLGIPAEFYDAFVTISAKYPEGADYPFMKLMNQLFFLSMDNQTRNHYSNLFESTCAYYKMAPFAFDEKVFSDLNSGISNMQSSQDEFTRSLASAVLLYLAFAIKAYPQRVLQKGNNVSNCYFPQQASGLFTSASGLEALGEAGSLLYYSLSNSNSDYAKQVGSALLEIMAGFDLSIKDGPSIKNIYLEDSKKWLSDPSTYGGLPAFSSIHDALNNAGNSSISFDANNSISNEVKVLVGIPNINYIPSEQLSVSDTKFFQEQFFAFPNPVHAGSPISFSFETKRQSDVHISLYDLFGRESASANLPALPGGSHQAQIPTFDIAFGIYTCVLYENGQKTSVCKISVIR